MSLTAVLGQLYLVKTRGEYKIDRTIEKLVMILQAANQEEVEVKLRYYMDFSKYINFSITHIEKIKPHVHTVSTKLIPVKDFIGLPESIQLEVAVDHVKSAGAQRTNQSSGNVFAVGVGGRMFATDEDHAMRYLGRYLLMKGLDQDCKNPLLDGGVIRFEQEGEIDSTVTSASLMKRMDATHFRNQRPMNGGLPSLGKR